MSSSSRFIIFLLFALTLIQISGQVNEIAKLDHELLLRDYNAFYDLNNQDEESGFSLKMIDHEDKLYAFFYSKEGFIKCTSFDNGDSWSTNLIHQLDYDRKTFLRYKFDVAFNSDGSYLLRMAM